MGKDADAVFDSWDLGRYAGTYVGWGRADGIDPRVFAICGWMVGSGVTWVVAVTRSRERCSVGVVLVSLPGRGVLDRIGVSGNGSGSAAGDAGHVPRRRLSRAHLVALTLAVLAGLVVYAGLRDRTEVMRVAVADRDVGSASELTDELVRWVEVPADSALADGLVDEKLLASRQWLAGRPLQQGEPLTSQVLVETATAEGRRSMSVVVARERASGGDLTVGDRVDVIDVAGAEVVYVVTDVEVLAVGDESSEPLDGSTSGFFVTLAVDDEEALRLAGAMADGEVDVVRSTGADAAVAGASATAPGGGGG